MDETVNNPRFTTALLVEFDDITSDSLALVDFEASASYQY